MGTNVFTDAGYAADDATVMAIRSDLAMRIAEFLKRRQLSQVAAARQLEVPQPTISKIINGRIHNLSIELLLRMLVRANVPVVIQTGSTVQDAGVYVAAGKSLVAAGISPAFTTPYDVRPQDFLFIPMTRTDDDDGTPALPGAPWSLASRSSGVAGQESE